VKIPSSLELMMEAIRVNDQKALEAARRVKSGITPPSAPFSLNENQPPSFTPPSQENPKK